MGFAPDGTRRFEASTVAGLKSSPLPDRARLERRLGADGWTGILLGKKTATFRDRAAGTTGFILRKSRTAKAETTWQEKWKAASLPRGFLRRPSLQNRLSYGHQGTEIICCCRSGIEGVGWKLRIAWLADWLEGKDSMIDCFRVLWIMGHSYLGRDRWTSFGQAEAIWA